jgi:hypothetical protein
MGVFAVNSSIRKTIHPLVPGLRVRVGNEVGVIDHAICNRGVREPAHYFTYVIRFEPGYTARIDQWWVVPEPAA